MSFFDGGDSGFGRMEGTDDAAGAEEFDSTYYDYGDGLANETADESTVEFTDYFESSADQVEDYMVEDNTSKFGQAFTFIDDNDPQGLPPRPPQDLSSGSDFFSSDSTKPTRSSSYISSDSSCSSSESTVFQSDHHYFRLLDSAADEPQATPVRAPSVQATITPSPSEEDSHLLSVAKELIFSPTSTDQGTNSPADPESAPRAALAAPAARPRPGPPASFTKKPPAQKVAFALSMPQILPAVPKTAPAAPVSWPKTTPAQAAAGSAPRDAPHGGTKRSAEGAMKPASAKPIVVNLPAVKPAASKASSTVTLPTFKMATTKAPAAAQKAAQPSLLSPPAATSSFFSAAGSSSADTSSTTSDKAAPKVRFVTPSGPKTSAAEEEDHLLAAFSAFSPIPGSATGGGSEHSALPRDTGIAMLVSPAMSHSAGLTGLEDEDTTHHDLDTAELPPYSQHFMPASSAAAGASTADPSTSDAQALQTCEEMGLRMEEANERLAKLRQAEREGRAKMAQKIAEAARLQSKFLAMDPMGSLAPLLMGLKLKMDQLHARQKRIAEVRGKEETSTAEAPDVPRHRDLEGLHAGTTGTQDGEVREVQDDEVHQEDGVTMDEDRQTGGGDGEEKEEREERNWEEGENRFVLVV